MCFSAPIPYPKLTLIIAVQKVKEIKCAHSIPQLRNKFLSSVINELPHKQKAKKRKEYPYVLSDASLPSSSVS